MENGLPSTVCRPALVAPDSKLSPEGLRSWLKTEIDRYGPMIKAAGVYAD